MNIREKNVLCAEVARVLRPGGTFVVYDVMRTAEGTLRFPVPWANVPETSFIATPAQYRSALEAAGFEIVAEHSRRAFALDFFHAMQKRLAEQGRPVLGLHILMGQNAPQKTANMIQNLQQGLLAPTEMIARLGV